jgi:hypothetical protein
MATTQLVNGQITGDYGRTDKGLPKLSGMAIDKAFKKISGEQYRDLHVLNAEESKKIANDLGWNLASDSAFVYQGPAAFGIQKKYTTVGMGNKSLSYSGDMKKVADQFKINPNLYTSPVEYKQYTPLGGQEIPISSLSATAIQNLIKQGKAKWAEDPVTGKQVLAQFDSKNRQSPPLPSKIKKCNCKSDQIINFLLLLLESEPRGMHNKQSAL